MFTTWIDSAKTKNSVNDSCLIAAQERMSYFVVGLTNVDPETVASVYKLYNYVQYNDTLPPSATASVSFQSFGSFRYVIIQKHFAANQAICMAEVKVFERGKLHAKTIISLLWQWQYWWLSRW